MDNRLGLPLEQPSLVTLLADRVRTGISEGQFAEGEKLSEADLAKELGVGRTTVREALRVLTAEKLLEKEPRKTWRVRSFSEHTVWEVATARAAIEGLAATLATQLLTEEIQERLTKVVSEMKVAANEDSYDEFSELDLHFHRLLLESSGNEILTELWFTIYSYSKLIVGCPQSDNLPMEEIAAGHEAILNAIVSGDPIRAEATVRASIIESYRHLGFHGYPEPWSRQQLGI